MENIKAWLKDLLARTDPIEATKVQQYYNDRGWASRDNLYDAKAELGIRHYMRQRQSWWTMKDKGGAGTIRTLRTATQDDAE
jgi:hypothetical protein